jgi:amino acid transporter
MSQHKLSLTSAILISLNIMVGFGIFVNTIVLSQLNGFLGFLAYALVAVMVAPLIFAVARLISLYPTGGFYMYGAENLGRLAGFLSAWGYFIGKLASTSLIIHVVMALFQTLIPLLAGINLLLLDALVIILFAFLNTWHMKVGSQLAGIFVVLKLTPILFAIFAGLYLLSTGPLTYQPMVWSGLPISIPFVVYAFIGFEAACSLSQSIENPAKNGPRVLYISFALAILVNILFQFLFFTGTEGAIMAKSSYLEAFPSLLAHLLPTNPVLAAKVVNFLHLAFASAALGGAYGILFATHWNLYALAEQKLVFFPKFFTKLNSHNIPVACVAAEAVVCISYLLLTRGNQIPLQQLSALGTTIAYTISSLALFFAYKRTGKSLALPIASLISCAIFMAMCIRNFILFDISSLYFFLAMIAIGLIMFFSAHFKRHQSNQA